MIIANLVLLARILGDAELPKNISMICAKLRKPRPVATAPTTLLIAGISAIILRKGGTVSTLERDVATTVLKKLDLIDAP